MKKNSFYKDARIIIKQVVLASPKIFFLMQFLAVCHGVSWGLNTLFTQKFFDRSSNYTNSNATLKEVFLSLAMLGGAYTFCQIINGVHSFVLGLFSEKVRGILQKKINNKIAQLDPKAFEDTEMLDCINKANEGKNNAVSFVMSGANIFFSYIPNYIFMTWYLFLLKPVLVYAILLVFIPTIFSQLVRIKAFVTYEDKAAPLRREFEHYEKCIADREFLKETRHLGAFSYFAKKYKDSARQLNMLNWKANLKNRGIELLLKVLTLTCYIGILLLVFYYLWQGDITVGAFAATIVPIGGLFDFFDGVVCGEIRGMVQHIGSIQNYISFLNLDERTGKDIELPMEQIVLDNVCFRYPNATQNAIEGVNLSIKKGETVVIVGENGSGKTTLVRVLTGLYLPTNGKVLYDNQDITRVSMKSLFRNSTGVFQKFQRYQMTLEDNISISDIENSVVKSNLDKVTEMAGVDVEDVCKFPFGYNTMLSREFGNHDISGGQWQRVAVARGLYRVSNLIILDEPTSAIDPLEEIQIFKRFEQAVKNRTAILVTHRLGTVKFADKIVVMDKGKIVGVGKHRELICSCKKYAAIYNSHILNCSEEGDI